LLRPTVSGIKVHERIKTLRYQVFAIAGYIVKNGSQRILKLSPAMKQREWFTGLWNNVKIFNPTVYLNKKRKV